MRPPYVTLSALLAACLSASCGGGNEYIAPPPPVVEVSKPERRDVTDYLEFTGTTEAVAMVEIRARLKGFLESIHFDEGDYVEEDALLYVIDRSEYQAAVDRAVGTESRRRAALGLAQATLDRLAEAVKTQAVSELEVIEARAKRDEAEASVAAAVAQTETARLELSYTEVRAPLAGRVGRSLVDPGNLVGAGENTLLTTLVQYDPIYADFDASERQILAIGEETSDAADEKDRLARIRTIPLELGRTNDDGYPIHGNLYYTDLAVDPETGTFLMRGVFPNPQPLKLIPGLFVKVRMPYHAREDALLVPERAFGMDQGGDYLLVVGEGDVVAQHRVELGARIDGMRVVLSGVEADDRVIVEGLLRARPGAKVTPTPLGTASPAAASADTEG